MSPFILKAIIVLFAVTIGFGVSYFLPGIEPDNPVEEKCEEIIKKETGLDIDLTPSSPEQKDTLDFKSTNDVDKQ